MLREKEAFEEEKGRRARAKAEKEEEEERKIESERKERELADKLRNDKGCPPCPACTK